MLAIIPARGGSKGVPRKNIKLLSNKPLIEYTIEAALQSKIFEEVVVSTDDEEIAEIAKSCGATIPFMRPANLALDLTTSDEVIKNVLDSYNKSGRVFTEVCKLQPTSPLRTSKMIQEAYELMQIKEKDFLVSVCECEHSPLWAGKLDKEHSLDEFIIEEAKTACRQALEPYYRLNGAIYMAKSTAFIQNGSFLGANGLAFIMKQEDSIDIDTELDFKLAELIMYSKMERGSR
ncbi:MAG: pseudaminic acid cytidylyltransferase [Eubacteriales bacterium]